MRLCALALCLLVSVPAFGGSGREMLVSLPGEVPASIGLARYCADQPGECEVPAPMGWTKYCADQPGECDVPALPPQNVKMTAAMQSELSRFNQHINEEISPVSDMDHWGVLEKWSQPTDRKGDCEDYALLKRKLLIEAGWPRQALLVTVVLDTKGGGHTVLTVITDRGEFILDNLKDEIRRPDRTGYRFLKRQSQEDPNRLGRAGGHDADSLLGRVE